MGKWRACGALVVLSLSVENTCASNQLGPSGEIPAVSAITPSSGPIGTSVQLEGSGFSPTGNVVKFGPGYLVDVSSPDGRTLRFTVPDGHNLCPPESLGLNEPCRDSYPPVMPGDYPVSIVTRSGSSRSVTFRVTTPQN